MTMNEKSLIITKLMLSSQVNQELKIALDSHYTDPKKFFELTTFNDLNNNQNNDNPTIYSQSFQFSKSKSYREIPIPPRIYSKRTFNNSKRRFGYLGNSLLPHGSKFSQTYTDDEILELYETFKLKKNSNSCHCIHKTKNDKPKTNNALIMQEKTLLKHKEINKKNHIISNRISKKINKCNSELLMNKTNDYRLKKEAIVLNAQYNYINNYWKTSLRQNELDIGQLKFDSNLFLVNKGTYNTPDYIWKNKDAFVERIRCNEPSYEDCSNEQSSIKPKKNKSMENIIFKKKKTFEIKKIEPLNIIGKNLLDQEINMFKQLKGPRFFCKRFPNKLSNDKVLFDEKSQNHEIDKRLIKRLIFLSKQSMII